MSKKNNFWQALAFSNQADKPLWKKINAELNAAEKQREAKGEVAALARQLERETGKSYRKCYYWASERLSKKEKKEAA